VAQLTHDRFETILEISGTNAWSDHSDIDIALCGHLTTRRAAEQVGPLDLSKVLESLSKPASQSAGDCFLCTKELLDRGDEEIPAIQCPTLEAWPPLRSHQTLELQGMEHFRSRRM